MQSLKLLLQDQRICSNSYDTEVSSLQNQMASVNSGDVNATSVTRKGGNFFPRLLAFLIFKYYYH